MFRKFGLLLGLATAVVLLFMVSNRCCLLRRHLIESSPTFHLPKRLPHPFPRGRTGGVRPWSAHRRTWCPTPSKPLRPPQQRGGSRSYGLCRSSDLRAERTAPRSLQTS